MVFPDLSWWPTLIFIEILAIGIMILVGGKPKNSKGFFDEFEKIPIANHDLAGSFRKLELVLSRVMSRNDYR